MGRIRPAAFALAAVIGTAVSNTAEAQQVNPGNAPTRDVQSSCPTGDPRAFHRCALERMKTFRAPRTPDGRANLNGLWRRTRTAQDIEEYSGEGILGIPPEKTMIVDPPDGVIPYQSWGHARRKEYLDKYISHTTFCFPSGVRYIPFGDTQILQRSDTVVMFQSRFHQHRIVPIDPSGPRLSSQVRLWNGASRGRWEGETLVVEVTNFNGMTTFDHAMNFATADVRITERFTMIDPDTIHWEATIEDPKVFARPWKMVLPLSRSKATGYDGEIWEDSCHEGSTQIGDMAPYFGAGYRIFPGVTLPH